MLSDKSFSGSNTDPYCGGTIVDKNTILSAAHCFGDQANQIKFKGGHISAGILLFEDAVWSIGTKKSQQHVKIKEIVLHDKYEIIKDPETDKVAYNFDVAIVKLKSPLKFNLRVKPACLPEPEFESKLAISSGWGNKKEIKGNGHTYQLHTEPCIVDRYLLRFFDCLVHPNLLLQALFLKLVHTEYQANHQNHSFVVG